jgi:hypothetical protein
MAKRLKELVGITINTKRLILIVGVAFVAVVLSGIWLPHLIDSAFAGKG